jgi:hypothetical protein
MIVNILQLIGSLLFIVGSSYAVSINNPLCITKNCHYDSSLWYLVGCFFFLIGNTIRLLTDYDQAEIEQKYIIIANEFGSMLFLVGSVVYFIDLKQQGIAIFFIGSCVFSVSLSYDYMKFRNKITLVFLGGSLLFILGDLVSNKTTANIIWLMGSILFGIGSSLGLVRHNEHQLIPRDIGVELV